MVRRLNLPNVNEGDPLEMNCKPERGLDSPDSGLPPSPSPSAWMPPASADKPGGASPICDNQAGGVSPICDNQAGGVSPICDNQAGGVSPICDNQAGGVSPICDNQAGGVSLICDNQAGGVSPVSPVSEQHEAGGMSPVSPVCEQHEAGGMSPVSPVSEHEGPDSLVPSLSIRSFPQLRPLSYGEGISLDPLPPKEMRYTSFLRYDSSRHFIQDVTLRPWGQGLERCSQTVTATPHSTWRRYKTQLEFLPRHRVQRFQSTAIIYPKHVCTVYTTELSYDCHRRAKRFLSSVELEAAGRRKRPQ